MTPPPHIHPPLAAGGLDRRHDRAAAASHPVHPTLWWPGGRLPPHGSHHLPAGGAVVWVCVGGGRACSTGPPPPAAAAAGLVGSVRGVGRGGVAWGGQGACWGGWVPALEVCGGWRRARLGTASERGGHPFCVPPLQPRSIAQPTWHPAAPWIAQPATHPPPPNPPTHTPAGPPLHLRGPPVRQHVRGLHVERGGAAGGDHGSCPGGTPRPHVLLWLG